MEAGEQLIAKEQLLKLYPDAYCEYKNQYSDTGYWAIISDQKMISYSFKSEELAWNYALTVTNNKILDKFKGN